MGKEFDGAALALLDRAFGLAGIGAQKTFLEDGDVQQVLDVTAPARRALTPFTTDGLFTSIFENVHAVSSESLSSADPYNPVNTHGTYPAPISADFDLWLLGLSVSVTAGAAAVTFASVWIDNREVAVGFSDINTGGPADIVNREFPLAIWTEFPVDAIPGVAASPSSGNRHVFQHMRMRWPRNNASMVFRTEVTAAATIFLRAQWGLFPVALGQDMGM